MEWSEIVKNKDSMVRPWYNKQFVIAEIKRIATERHDYEESEIDSVLSGFDGSVVVGRVIKTDDLEANMMFGLNDCGVYLDDQGLFDYILHAHLRDLVDYGAIFPGDMESVTALYYDDVSEKELHNVLSYIIGESLSDPNVPAVDKISTKVCKDHLENAMGLSNMKRTKKVKFGLIDIREFSNDAGSEATLLSYNGRIINSYTFTSSDYE